MVMKSFVAQLLLVGLVRSSIDAKYLTTEENDLQTRQLQSASFLGCFRDKPDRALPVRISGDGFSLDQCLNGCQSLGYTYGARQWLGECYCGNSGYDKYGPVSNCNACDSENVGGYRNCVYRLSDPGPTPPPTPKPTTSPTSKPTTGPTFPPTPKPTSAPQSTASPTVPATTEAKTSPTLKPTAENTVPPSYNATTSPTPKPTAVTTVPPTLNATTSPTSKSTISPTVPATTEATTSPTPKPTAVTTVSPSFNGTTSPTLKSTISPTVTATTEATTSPTSKPTAENTVPPTLKPTTFPTSKPTTGPTFLPTPNPTSASQSGPLYLGCFRDKPDRALPVKISGGGFSLDQCLNGCQSLGYTYGARQYLGECYCGNSGYDKHGPRNDCNACDSENVGGYKNCVYKLSDPGPTPPPTPKPTPAPVKLPEGHCAANNGYGGAAYFDYNNQANWKNVNGNTNDKVRWSKFPSIFNFKMQNQCGFGNQSPINVCDGSSGPKNENAECYEHHRIFQHTGVWKLSQTDRIKAQIFGSKLRLEYKTRDWGPHSKSHGNSGPNKYTGWCPLIKKSPSQMCGPDLPPLADFPHHWHGHTQVNHIDFKFPSEHTICGKQYAAEIVIWFAWVQRRAAINMAIMVDVGNHNPELEKVISRFEQVNQEARNRCKRRNLRAQNLNFTDSSESGFDYPSSNETLNDLSESHRQLAGDDFNPFSSHIVRTEYFYGYWGTTTEPPCLGQAPNPNQWIAWRVMDKASYMSANQLKRLQSALLTNVDDNCKCTSVARIKDNQWSVARDLQPTKNRSIFKCRPGKDW